jgi:DNA-binding beta-propeller fold protein YncE
MQMRADNTRTVVLLPANLRFARRLIAALFAALLVVLASAHAAHAADRIYWSNYNNATISWENLDGSAGGQFPTGGAPIDGPNGLAIDAATGRIYWANYGLNPGFGTTIGWAMVDGSGVSGVLQTPGATVTGPHGVAIDPVTRRIYWPNAGNGGPGFTGISWAALDGSGGADLTTTLGCSDEPRGVAIDPVARRIYWANHSAPTNSGFAIASAPLDGSSCSFVATGSATNAQPEGVAIDPVTNTIYWASFSGADKISWARLDGSAGGDLNTGSATVDHPHGVVVDPEARRIYWANANSNVLSSASLDNNGVAGDIPTPAGANPNGPDQPILVKVPAGKGAPQISGGSHLGSSLRCTQASWAGDMLSSLLYRAPESISDGWTKNGSAVAGATSKSIVASTPSNYRCVETASDPAGSTSQQSEAIAVFKIGKAKLNKKRGTAKLAVRVPGNGTIGLSGRGVVKEPKGRRARASNTLSIGPGPRTVKLLVKPKGKTKRRLVRTGRVKVKVKVTDTPNGSGPDSQTKKVKLRFLRA